MAAIRLVKKYPTLWNTHVQSASLLDPEENQVTLKVLWWFSISLQSERTDVSVWYFIINDLNTSPCFRNSCFVYLPSHATPAAVNTPTWNFFNWSLTLHNFHYPESLPFLIVDWYECNWCRITRYFESRTTLLYVFCFHFSGTKQYLNDSHCAAFRAVVFWTVSTFTILLVVKATSLV